MGGSAGTRNAPLLQGIVPCTRMVHPDGPPDGLTRWSHHVVSMISHTDGLDKLSPDLLIVSRIYVLGIRRDYSALIPYYDILLFSVLFSLWRGKAAKPLQIRSHVFKRDASADHNARDGRWGDENNGMSRPHGRLG